jgi:hypothetical protein
MSQLLVRVPMGVCEFSESVFKGMAFTCVLIFESTWVRCWSTSRGDVADL